MSEMPVVAANSRFDVEARAAGSTTVRIITHSGRLLFGDTTVAPRSTTVAEFNGLIPLPDSHSFRSEALDEAVISMDLWAINTRGYSFVSGYEAKFLDDPRQPGTSWIHIGMQIACDSGSVIGYRVTVQVPPPAIVE